jgi:hypothetical protein
MAVTINKQIVDNTPVIVASDQITGNDFGSVAVDTSIDYTGQLERIAVSLESIAISLQSLTGDGGVIGSTEIFGNIAMYKLFIEQGRILDKADAVDGETAVKAANEVAVYRRKLQDLVDRINNT